MDFVNIPNKYSPIPFWSWNDKLEVEETIRQVEEMKKVGLGGFFMHARGGLVTEYMGKEWFQNVEAATKKAEELDMDSWVYDENGWPSGFANGKVNGLGVEYCQKILRISKEKPEENILTQSGEYWVYYEVNPFYVDSLDKKVIKEFLNNIHEEYYKKMGNRIKGFFTDEPEASNDNIPWSFILPEKYKEEYGDDLVPKTAELFIKTGDYKVTRMRFWRLVTKLFSESYVKQIYDWCSEHNMILTGHLPGELSLRSQISATGSCMPHYEYFHIPGIDWLGRELGNSLSMHQLVSAALQTGKTQILTESFGLCGHNVSFSELRGVYEWQMVRGINLLCQHLEGYTMRGLRKRDYPPAMYYQQPWWNEYKAFNDSMSRIGMLIAEGKPECNTLVIHTQTSAWICHDNDKNEGLLYYNDKLIDIIDALEKKHIQFHLGHEILMERHGRVEGNKLIIGQMEYDTVIVPPHIAFFENTERLLKQFADNGGKILSADELPENPVIDNEEITYLKRVHKDFDVHYFVNSTNEFKKAKINVNGQKLDIMTGETAQFDKDYTFTPFDSLVVIDYREPSDVKVQEDTNEILKLDGEFEIEKISENSLTLDVCDCYFDGELHEKNMPVISIQERACKLRRKVEIRCVYNVELEFIPDDICLVCETPEIYSFRINGQAVDFKDAGFFKDVSFRKTLIKEFMKQGTNEIELTCNFLQSEQVYDDFENSVKCQTVLNKLTYDMEIESIYLTGGFSVKTPDAFETLDKKAYRYSGDFIIAEPKKSLSLKNIEQQGYPFFCGDITLKKNICVDDVNKNLVLSFTGINAIKIKINDKELIPVIWNYEQVDLSSYLKIGENKIEITLYNNLRNLLGPHHMDKGECLDVRPRYFYQNESIWVKMSMWQGPVVWNDGYCFVETSVY